MNIPLDFLSSLVFVKQLNEVHIIIWIFREVLAVSGPKMLIFDPEREQEDFYFKNQKVKGK